MIDPLAEFEMCSVRPLIELTFGALQIADNDSEQIVEIVSNATGQMPDCIKSLRLPQRFFGRKTPIGFGVKPLSTIGIGLTYEKYGLSCAGGKEPMLDPQTVWGIPPDINIEPVPLPPRPILSEEIVVLNERRAGNRGRANRT
jgi:hypothetical protein